MNAVATAAPPKIQNASPAIAWFPVAVFALVWLEVISRLRFEWSKEKWTVSGRLDAVKRGKRDVGTQTLELVAWGYDDSAKAEAAAIEQLRQIIKPG